MLVSRDSIRTVGRRDAAYRMPVSCLSRGQVECYNCIHWRLGDGWDPAQSTACKSLPCVLCKVKQGHFVDNEPVTTNPEQFGLPGPGRSKRPCRPTKLLVCQPLVEAKVKPQELNRVIQILYELLTGKPLAAGPDGRIYYP
jgi:hypothetical protein